MSKYLPNDFDRNEVNRLRKDFEKFEQIIKQLNCDKANAQKETDLHKQLRLMAESKLKEAESKLKEAESKEQKAYKILGEMQVKLDTTNEAKDDLKQRMDSILKQVTHNEEFNCDETDCHMLLSTFSDEYNKLPGAGKGKTKRNAASALAYKLRKEGYFIKHGEARQGVSNNHAGRNKFIYCDAVITSTMSFINNSKYFKAAA